MTLSPAIFPRPLSVRGYTSPRDLGANDNAAVKDRLVTVQPTTDHLTLRRDVLLTNYAPHPRPKVFNTATQAPLGSILTRPNADSSLLGQLPVTRDLSGLCAMTLSVEPICRLHLEPSPFSMPHGIPQSLLSTFVCTPTTCPHRTLDFTLLGLWNPGGNRVNPTCDTPFRSARKASNLSLVDLQQSTNLSATNDGPNRSQRLIPGTSRQHPGF